MLVDLGRNDLGRVARPGRVRSASTCRSSATATSSTSCATSRAQLQPGPRRAGRAARRLPGRHAERRAKGARDAAHRRARGGAARAVRRGGRLPGLRRLAGHRDRHPQRGPARRPGPRPHGRRDRRRLACPSASSRRPSTRRRRSGARSSRRRRARTAPGAEPGSATAAVRGRRDRGSGDDPRHRQLRLFTFNLVQALEAAGADVRVVRNDAIDRAGLEALADEPRRGPARDRHLARARATRTTSASRWTRSRLP